MNSFDYLLKNNFLNVGSGDLKDHALIIFINRDKPMFLGNWKFIGARFLALLELFENFVGSD